MTTTIKAAIITGFFGLATVLFGWYLNRLTTHDAITEITAKYDKEIARQKVMTDLVRFQTVSHTSVATRHALSSHLGDGLISNKADLKRSLDESVVIMKQFPFIEWVRFCRVHIKPTAIEGMNELSEKRAQLPVEIQTLINDLPEPVTNPDDAARHSRILEQVLGKLNELGAAQARFAGIVESITEADILVESK